MLLEAMSVAGGTSRARRASAGLVWRARLCARTLLASETLVLPPLSRVPSVGKVVAYLTARTGSERLFRDVRSLRGPWANPCPPPTPPPRTSGVH